MRLVASQFGVIINDECEEDVMKFFVLMLAFAATTAFAQSVGPQDIEPMLQQMQASGQIDAKQAEITRKYMKTMDSKKWAEIEKKAEDCIARNPAMADKIREEGSDAINMDICR